MTARPTGNDRITSKHGRTPSLAYRVTAAGAFVGTLPGAVACSAILIAIKRTNSLSALNYEPLGLLAVLLLFAGGAFGCWLAVHKTGVARPGITAAVFECLALALTGACVYVGVVSGQTIYAATTALEYVAITGLSAVGAAWIATTLTIRVR